MPRLITIGESVYEVVAETPAGSLLLLHRTGLARRRIEDLERRLADARAALERAERDAVSAAAPALTPPTPSPT